MNPLLQQALALHQQGKLQDAARLYAEVLRQQPSDFDANHLLGVVAMQMGRPDEGIKLVGRALAANPRSAAAHNNLGKGLSALARHGEALESFRRAIALQPDLADAHLNLGAALRATKRHAEALESYDRLLKLKPDNAEAHAARGNALDDLQRREEAVASFDQAIALDPRFAEAYSNRGAALVAMERIDEALADYDRAIALKPGLADAHGNKAVALGKLRRAAEALPYSDKAIALAPGSADAHNGRGAVLRDLKRFEEALACYDKALAIDPAYAEVYSNRAHVLRELSRNEEAIADYRRALELDPRFVDATFNLSLCLLALGRFEEGWQAYEARKAKREPTANRAYPQPVWTGGESLRGKSLFLHWEQGFGDTIQFMRYAKPLLDRGADVSLSVQGPLQELVARSLPAVRVLGPRETPEHFDYHAPLMSLPLAFGTDLASIPAEISYLRCDEAHLAEWRARLGEARKPRIGLTWSGNAKHVNDLNRSIELAQMLSIVDDRFEFVSLQKDLRDGDAALIASSGLRHFGDELRDFSDTAALCQLMDAVVSVDTSAAHLAGALNKPLFLLLPFCPDWRWLLERSDSPWYRSARLFRQTAKRDWAEPLAEVRAAMDGQFAA